MICLVLEAQDSLRSVSVDKVTCCAVRTVVPLFS